MHAAVAVGSGKKGDVQRKQRGSEGAMDENAFVTCVSVCLCAAVATAAPSDPLPSRYANKAQMNLRELNMLKVTTTSSIEATVSPETKFDAQLKQTSLADGFTCAIMRRGIHAKKITQGRSEETGERYRSSNADGRSVGRPMAMAASMIRPSVRARGEREGGREGVT